MTYTRQRMSIYLNLLTLLVGTAHLSLMILAINNRLTYSVPPRYQLLEQTLSNNLWVILHGSCFVAVVVAVALGRAYVPVLSAATGVMAAWAFLSLLWGLSAAIGPSLSGPVLAGGMATLSYILASSWAHIPPRKKDRGML